LTTKAAKNTKEKDGRKRSASSFAKALEDRGAGIKKEEERLVGDWACHLNER